MSEMDDLRHERLFDDLLSEAEQWQAPPDALARRAAESDEAVAADLALIAELQTVRPGREEIEFARARVGQRLAKLMREEPAPPEIVPALRDTGALRSVRARLRALTAPPCAADRRTVAERQADSERRAAVGRTWARRVGTLAAAVLLVAFASVTLASATSAQALPESPLYAVKRAEEAVLLSISWGDESQGQTLDMIANHRLVEASSEADQRRMPEARALLGQFDSTFSQLIDLAAHAQARHEDTATYTSAIRATLDAEQVAATRASAHGEPTFAQAVGASAQAATTHIQAVGVTIPALPESTGNGENKGKGHDQGKGNGQGQGNGHGNASGKPQQTPDPQATPTPQATRTPYGSGAGQGHYPSNSNQDRGPSPTPTVTPNGG